MTQKYQVKVSMKQAAIVETGIVLKQGDFGMQLEIEVLDFDATGTTPQIVFRKAMGAVESTTITVSGNKYTYTFKGTELDTPGKCFCDLKLKNSTTQRISTASFMFKVVADTLDGLAEEASSYSDTIEQIVSGFDDDITDLNRKINQESGFNRADKASLFFEWEQGGLSSSTAAEYSSNEAIRTKFIDIRNLDTFAFTNDILAANISEWGFWIYDDSQQPIKRLVYNNSTGYSSVKFVNDNASYMRLYMAHWNTRFTPDNGDYIQCQATMVNIFKNVTDICADIVGKELSGQSVSSDAIPNAWITVSPVSNATSLILAGKNLLIDTGDIGASRTVNGITCVKNDDGTYTVNGTASADAIISVGNVYAGNGIHFIWHGTPNGGSDTTYCLGVSGYGKTYGIGNMNGLGGKTYMYIFVGNGTTVSNLTFSPMIELGTTRSTFVAPEKDARVYSIPANKNIMVYNKINKLVAYLLSGATLNLTILLSQNIPQALSSISSDISGLNQSVSDINTSLDCLDERIYSCSNSREFKNALVYRGNKAKVSYTASSTYTDYVITDSLPISKDKIYTLYCGYIDAPASALLRVYIKYEDDSVSRFNVTASSRILMFKTANKNISSAKLLAIAVNGTATGTAGTAIFIDYALFEGALITDPAFTGKRDLIPDYYMSHLLSKEAIIRGHQKDCSYNGEAFVFITDTHYSYNYLVENDLEYTYINASNSIGLVKHIVDNAGIMKVVFGGDLLDTADGVDKLMNSAHAFKSRFDEVPIWLISVVGNHEYYTDLNNPELGRPTANELYGGFIKANEEIIISKGPMDSYCFDNQVQKIRYLIISCGRDTETTTSQIEWALSTLLETPANYKIITIGHAFLTDDTTAFRESHEDIINALGAIKTHTSYTYNNIEYDYSNLSNADVVCVITGHSHLDGNLESNDGVLCICTTCDNYYRQTGGITRTKGTINEQAFDVVQIDFDNRKIYCTRIGYGDNREFDY